MKSNCLLLVFLAIFCGKGFAQECIPEAQIPAKTNDLGDPITNSIDADGSRQGEWFFQDVFGIPVLKQLFENNTLVATWFPRMHADRSISWESENYWSTNQALQLELEAAMNETLGVLLGDQQLMLLFTPSGELLRFAPLGNWTESDIELRRQALQNYINNHQIIVSNATYILL